ncbi:MAG TPA: hypothetical protein VHV52_06290 [Gaiellaceae bacterium]|nr:hypothetical protein [Gaiellaceae bacterium]
MKVGRRWRSRCVALIVVAFVVASLGGTVGAGAASRPAKIDITAQRISANTIAGGATELLVTISNLARAGGAAAASPSVTISGPTGFAYDGATNLDRVPGFGGVGTPGARLSCRGSGGAVTCTYGGSLAAGGVVTMLVRFKTPASAKAGGRGVFRVVGGGSAAGRGASAAVGIVAGPGSPALYAEIQPAGIVRTDRPSSELIQVLNTGSTPATSVQLADLLPANLVGSWSAAGAGWTCTGAQTSPPSCANSRPIRPGEFAPPLRISFALDQARVEAMQLPIGGKATVNDWSVAVTSTGGVRTFTVQSPAELAIMPPPGALLMATAVAKRGLQELLPGDEVTIDAKLSNIGGAPTDGPIGLGGSIPAGTSIVRVGAGGAWQCQGGEAPSTTPQSFTCVANDPRPVAVRGAVAVPIVLKVDVDAKPGPGSFELSGVAKNTIAGARPRSTALQLLILEGNKGFPALTLLRPTGKHGAFRPVTDGAPAKLISGLPFTERLDVRNAGGASINPGETATLEQTLGGGATIKSIQNAPGWSCTGATSLTCSVSFTAALAPAAGMVGPTIVIDAGAATKAERSWPATIRLTGSTAPTASKLPVLVTVTHGEYHLIPDFTNIHVPTAGGTGAFGLSVRNTGDIATTGPVVLAVHLPHGVRLASLVEAGWSCDTAATSARCTSAGPLQAGHRLPHLKLNVSFARGTELKTLSLEARATVGSRTAPKSARAAIQVEPRHTLRAVIKEPDKVAFADQPLVKANEKLKPTVLTLEGDGSGGSGIGLHYRWTQRSGPSVTWLGPRNEADVRFSTPQVTKSTPVEFALTVNDGSASSTDTVRIKIVPLPSGSSGFTIRDAHPKAEKPNGPLREKRRLPKPAEKLKKTTKKAPRVPAASSTATDTTTTTATTTDETTTGETTTGETTTSGPSLPPIFCQLVRDAVNSSGSFNGTVGGISFGFESIHVSGSDDCSADTKVSFSGSTFGTSSLKATGVDGSISASGLTITAGTLTGPEAWRSPTFTLGGAGLSIPFDAGTVSLNGTIKADGFAFVPLPSGWSGSTTVAFQAGGSGGTSVSVDTTATGPTSDASPDSPAPTAEIQGAVSSDGTFSLSVDVQQIVQLAGSPVNLSGSVKRESPDGAITASFEGSITKPITIVKGLDINTLTVKMEPTDTSLGLTGSGQLALSTPNGTAAVDVKLAYDNPKNWSLTATGAGDATWSPLPGLTIAAKDFSGAIVAKDDTYDLTLKVAPSADWKPSSSVTISNLELTLSNTCDDTGAACPTSADVFLNLKGDVAFALPVIGTVNTTLAGTLALPTGEFSVKASLAQPLSIAAGIQITNASVLIQRGMSAPSEDPSAETNDSGDFRVDLEGAVSVPGIGQLPTVHASFGNQGWAIAVPLGGFSLPGGSGDGSTLGNAVVGWASYATKLDVVDPVTKAVTKIDLPANAFKLTGTFSTPSWMRTTLGLSSDINGRATGVFDPDHDTYSLRMDFAVPGQPYLYGNANSKSNVRLNSTYFEIARTGGDFNVALGGAATMNVAGGGGTAASSIDLGVALSYSITSQTVAGTLSFSSAAGWTNAFGVQQLKLFDLAVAFTFNIPSLTPGVGFGASAQLPSLWQSKLGIQNNAKTLLVANISVTNPCLAIQVDDPTNTGQTVLSLGSGAVTASAFDVEVAPTGCTVGQFVYQPGVSLNFAGTIAGVSVAVKATVLLNPFSFTASADIGEFTVAGLTVKKTHIDVALSTSAFNVNFSGGVSVGGTDVDISGGVNKSGGVLITNFTGTLNQLNLGSGAVTANKLAVTIHTETGAGKNNAKFTMSGAVTILTASANGNFTLSIQNGQLNQLVADINANVVLGGSAGLALNGTFHVNYQQNQPFSLTANVAATFAGQSLANVSVNLQPSFLQINASFSIGSVFSAQLQGAAYYGTVPKGTTITIPDGATVAAQTGDFLLSAKDVTLSLAGFTGKASVYLAKAGGVTQGGLSGSLQILGTGTGNSVNIAGTFQSGGNFTLNGSANLNLAGFTANTAVTVAKTGSNVSVSGKAAMTVLGSSATLAGDFNYTGGQFRYRMSAVVSINAGGYNLSNSTVKFSNYPEDAGLSAQVSFSPGGIVSVNGKLNIDASGGFFLSVNTSLNLRVTTVNATVTFTAGPQQRCTPVYTYITFPFGLRIPIPTGVSCGTVNVPPTLTAAATVGSSGFSFGVNVTISGNGSFSATARTPVTGESTGTTPTISLLVVRGYAYFSYHMQLTIQSGSPYLAVDGAGSAGIKYQHWEVSGWPWDWGWSGWKDGPSLSASIRTNPFQACGYANLFGKDVGGCIS